VVVAFSLGLDSFPRQKQPKWPEPTNKTIPGELKPLGASINQGNYNCCILPGITFTPNLCEIDTAVLLK